MKQLEIKLIALSIIAFLMYLCKDTLNEYMSHFLSVALALSVVVSFYFVIAGLYKLAMLRLDYMERVGQVAQANRQTLLLSAGQSAVIFDNDTQTMVTAPTAQPMVEAIQETIKEQTARLLNFKKLIKTAYHFAVQGSTGDGKTTIVIELLNYIREPFPNADVMIIDPKNGDGWPIKPQVTSLEKVMDALQSAWAGLKKRVDSRDKSSPPVIIIIDEHDWLTEDLGDEYIKTIRKIFKVGREYNYHLILIGQSPLSKDNKLSGSDWDNFGRIMLGKAATKFIKYGLTWKEMRKDLEEKLGQLIKNGQRASIISPAKYLPFVAEIPHIEPAINFEIKPIRIDNWPTKRSDIKKTDGRTDGRVKILRKAISKGMPISRENCRIVLKKHGLQFSNSDYQKLMEQARK